MKEFKGGLTVLMSVYIKVTLTELYTSLNSIFANTILPDKVIIIKDGPVSKDVDIYLKEAIILNKIEVHEITQNVGLAKALNYGLSFVKTEWIARVDADDYNVKNRFEIQLKLLKSSNWCIDIIGGSVLEFDSNQLYSKTRLTPLNHFQIKKQIKWRNPFNHMTVIYRTSLVIKCGGYPPLFLKEDYGLWAKLISNGAICANTKEVLVYSYFADQIYKRRGGLKYVLSDFHLQRFLLKLKYKNLAEAIYDFIRRSIVFLSPPIVRCYVYKSYLRV